MTGRLRNQPTPDGPDEVDQLLAEQMKDHSGFAAAYEDARARSNLYSALVMGRKAAGLTQAEVAAPMELPVKRIVEFEGGAVDPSWSFLQSYARAVGVRLAATVEADSVATMEADSEAKGGN